MVGSVESEQTHAIPSFHSPPQVFGGAAFLVGWRTAGAELAALVALRLRGIARDECSFRQVIHGDGADIHTLAKDLASIPLRSVPEN